MTFSRKDRKPLYGQSRVQVEENPEFEHLFQQNWTRICQAIYRLVGDWAEAEDLALDTFVRLYRRPPGSGDNPGGWLYRVATNLGLNALRARKRRQQYEEEAGFIDLEPDTPWDPSVVIEQAQDRERVRSVLAQMKPRTAQLLVLRHSGLSYAEIAQALDLAPGSVGALLARAEQQFEQLYLQQEPS